MSKKGDVADREVNRNNWALSLVAVKEALAEELGGVWIAERVVRATGESYLVRYSCYAGGSPHPLVVDYDALENLE